MKDVEGWETESLGRLAHLTMGQSPDSKYYSEEENGLPFLQGCAEFEARFPKHKMYCSQTKKLAHVGSILFSVRAPVGKINIADCDYIIGRGLAAISGIDVDQFYLEHYLIFKEPNFRNASQGSTFEAINFAELNGWPINYPTSKPEQTKIAEIISTVDRAIEQTDALITKQQRIKTGLMQDLLTRGIDRHGNLRSEQTHQFKDSSLGRIPVEWEVVKVKSIAKIVTGNRDTQDRDGAAEYPFFVRSQQVERIGTYSFDGEAVLTAGDGVGTGKVFHYINGKFDFHQRVYCLHSFKRDMDGYFFFQYFRANFMDRVSQFSAKGSVDSVRMAMIIDMLIPKPNLDEQKAVSNILGEAETILSDYASSAEKLHSLKTSLMQDLLTGKVQVTPLLNNSETGV